jgi:hypothetical protein
MPVMAIYRSDAISAEGFAKYRATAPLSPVPREALSHAYARTADGGMIVVDVWSSRAALQAFTDQVIKPALAENGLPWSEPEITEVETFMVTPDSRAYELPFAPLKSEPA